MMHKCPYPSCYARISSSVFACHTHWFMLPSNIRRAIWRHWRSGDMDKHAAAMAEAMDWYRANS